jgi:hypothetical protein
VDVNQELRHRCAPFVGAPRAPPIRHSTTAVTDGRTHLPGTRILGRRRLDLLRSMKRVSPSPVSVEHEYSRAGAWGLLGRLGCSSRQAVRTMRGQDLFASFDRLVA